MQAGDRTRGQGVGGHDQRSLQERRGGLDRRGSNTQPASQARERAYGFREFRERRGHQDRRLYGVGGRHLHRAETETGVAGCFVYLTSEEVATLLSEFDQ